MLVADEHTIPCENRIANRMPNVAAEDMTTAPSVLTAIAVVIICAQVKSIPQTSVTCPVMFAHPVIQLARAEYFGGANLAEK